MQIGIYKKSEDKPGYRRKPPIIKNRRNGVIFIDKALLPVKEFCKYLGIGDTKARELLRDPSNGFTVRIGNRLYAHKGRLDEWLLTQIL